MTGHNAAAAQHEQESLHAFANHRHAAVALVPTAGDDQYFRRSINLSLA
jgi:hypothetical protein